MSSADPLILANAYLPTLYNLLLDISHSKPNFKGKLTVPLIRRLQLPDEEPFRLTLDAHKLVVTLAVAHSEHEKHPLSIAYDRTARRVTFTGEAGLPLVLKVVITYMGTISVIKTYNDATYGVFKTNYLDLLEGKSDNYIIATHAQPFGCRMIFPVIDDLSHKVPISLEITTSASYKVASNSPLASKNNVDMSLNAIFTFKPTPPISSAAFGFVLGDLERVEDIARSVPVGIYTTKGDSSLALYALKVITTLLPIFEKIMGVPYPLEKFDMVALPFLSDAAMENWGLVTVIRNAILLDHANNSDLERKQVRQLVAHQLTHQWIGNLVTLDEWKHMWLIEALATYVGNYILSVAKMEESDASEYAFEKQETMQQLMDEDCSIANPVPSFYDHMNQIEVTPLSTTASIFNKLMYDKGLVFVNMVANLFTSEDFEDTLLPFFAAFKKVLETCQFKSVKPFEIWNILNEFTTSELLSFASSWTRYPGYPLLTVTQSGDKTRVQQSRFLYDDRDLDSENPPFHAPLAIKVLTDKNELKLVSVVLTDRSIVLDLPVDRVLCLNSGNQFYYKTVYSPEYQETILKNVPKNRYLALDLIGLIKDYGKILGQPIKTEQSALFGPNQAKFLMQLLEAFTQESWNIDYDVLQTILVYLEILDSIFVHFTEYNAFQAWLGSISMKLYNKIGDWDIVLSLTNDDYDSVEYHVRNIVLGLCRDHKEIQVLCKKLYKNFFQSGVSQKFTPKELYPLMFNVTMVTAGLPEYKHILLLVKNSDVSFLRHSNGTKQDVQTAAVLSLSFCSDKKLITKTLNFVNTNIDSKLIELSLIGFKYRHASADKLLIWDWFKVNYDQWVRRSLRKGSDWSKQIGVTTGNISNLVLGEIMQSQLETAKAFVELKVKALPPHQLEKRWEDLMLANEEKRRIAEYYSEII